MQCVQCNTEPATQRAAHGSSGYSYPFCSPTCSKVFCRQMLIGPPIEGGPFGIPVGSWADMPDEMKLAVLEKIPLLRLLQKARVDKNLDALIKDESIWRSFYLNNIKPKLGTPDRLILQTWRAQTLQYLQMFDYLVGYKLSPRLEAPVVAGKRIILFEEVVPAQGNEGVLATRDLETWWDLYINHALKELPPKEPASPSDNAFGSYDASPNSHVHWVVPASSTIRWKLDSFSPKGMLHLCSHPIPGERSLLVRPTPDDQSVELVKVIYSADGGIKVLWRKVLEEFQFQFAPFREPIRFISGKSNPKWPIVHVCALNASDNMHSFQQYVMNPQVLGRVLASAPKGMDLSHITLTIDGTPHVLSLRQLLLDGVRLLHPDVSMPSFGTPAGFAGSAPKRPTVDLKLDFTGETASTIEYENQELALPVIFLLYKWPVISLPRIVRPRAFTTMVANMDSIFVQHPLLPVENNNHHNQLTVRLQNVEFPATGPFERYPESDRFQDRGFAITQIHCRFQNVDDNSWIYLNGQEGSGPPFCVYEPPQPLNPNVPTPAVTPLTLSLEFALGRADQISPVDDHLHFQLPVMAIQASGLQGVAMPDAPDEAIDIKLNLRPTHIIFRPLVGQAEMLAKWRKIWEMQFPMAHATEHTTATIVMFDTSHSAFVGRYFPRTGVFLPVKDASLARYADPERNIVDATATGIAHRLG